MNTRDEVLREFVSSQREFWPTICEERMADEIARLRNRINRMEQVCLMAQILTSLENPNWLTDGDWADFRAAVTAMDKEM